MTRQTKWNQRTIIRLEIVKDSTSITTITAVDEPKGFITFGPRDSFYACVQVCYVPTNEQIANIQKYFGWDFITPEELKRYNEG